MDLETAFPIHFPTKYLTFVFFVSTFQTRLDFFGPQMPLAYNGSKRFHRAQKISISRAPLALVMDLPASKHYIRGLINHRYINIANLSLRLDRQPLPTPPCQPEWAEITKCTVSSERID
jgi:hypothetical protein